MPVITNAGGGGGAGSDECTLVKANVPIGLKAVMADSNDEAVEGALNVESSASDSHVLDKQTYFKYNFITGRWEKRIGARKNNGALNATLNCGESYTIPAGDTTGGKVTARDLPSQTQGTAVAADIIAGKTATVNGVKITGIKVDYGVINATLNCGQSRVLPAGSINGGTITAASLESQTPGNATAGVILPGYSAWVNGVKIPGNAATKGAQTYTPGRTNQVIAANQYLTGPQTIAGDANLLAENIRKNVSIMGIIGSWEGYTSSPLYLYNNGVWSNLQTTGMNNTTPNGSVLSVGSNNNERIPRLNQTVDLTAYNYIKVSARVPKTGTSTALFNVGVSTKSTEREFGGTGIPTWARTQNAGGAFFVGILNVSSLTGFYYIYVGSMAITQNNIMTYKSGEINQIFLSVI